MTAFRENSDTDMLIRPAVLDDIPALCALENECFSLPWSERAFLDFFSNGISHCLVAELDGHLCGYVGMNLIEPEGEITNIAVSGQFRRRGVARALVEHLCKTDGLGRLMLDVRVSNAPAIALYEKCGFKSDGVRKGFYSKPREDALLMSLEINDQRTI